MPRLCSARPNIRLKLPVKGFAGLDAAQEWAAHFVHWYNDEHRHSGIKYVTPAQRHAGQDRSVLTARHELYQRARRSNPHRWSGRTRDWTPVAAVTLNPERDTVVQAAASRNRLSGSAKAPAFPSRPDGASAMARNAGQERSTAARSHAQRPLRREHGEDGAHRTFPEVSTMAHSGSANGPGHRRRPVNREVLDKGRSLRNASGNLLDIHRFNEGRGLHNFFEMHDGSCLAFFEVPGKPFDFKRQDTLDLHIAVGVEPDMFDRMLDKARTEGVEVRGPVDHGFCRSIYMRDPNV
jgi:hypothetical protein